MKTTLLLLLVFLLASSFLHAQIDKGRVQIGGQFNFSDYHYNQSSGATNLTTVLFSPAIGRFYATNKLAGVFLNFSYNGFSSSKLYGYGGGVYFRQYQPILKGLYVFADEQVTFTYTHGFNNASPSSVLNNYSLFAGIKPGIAYDLTKRMQLEVAYNNLLSVAYTYQKGTQQFSLNSNLEGSGLQNLLVGFRFYLK